MDLECDPAEFQRALENALDTARHTVDDLIRDGKFDEAQAMVVRAQRLTELAETVKPEEVT